MGGDSDTASLPAWHSPTDRVSQHETRRACGTEGLGFLLKVRGKPGQLLGLTQKVRQGKAEPGCGLLTSLQ